VKRGHPLIGTTPRTLAPRVATLRGSVRLLWMRTGLQCTFYLDDAARESGRSTGGDRLTQISLKPSWRAEGSGAVTAVGWARAPSVRSTPRCSPVERLRAASHD
jgi:hypothetical protein